MVDRKVVSPEILELCRELENSETDDESDISIFSVNTEDLSDLEFSEDDKDGEIRWSRDPAPVNVTPFTSRSGAISRIAEDDTAKEFFQLFVTEELVDMVVEETNRYARQYITRKPDPKWHDTNRKEMNAFFGLHVLLGYHKLPDTTLFWSKDETLGVSFVKKVMPRDRFDKLSQYLHLNNNEKAIPRGQPNHDKLFKVQPFLEAVVKSFHEEYRQNQNLSINEGGMCRCIKWLRMQSSSLHWKTRWQHHRTWTWLPRCARAEPAFYWKVSPCFL